MDLKAKIWTHHNDIEQKTHQIEFYRQGMCIRQKLFSSKHQAPININSCKQIILSCPILPHVQEFKNPPCRFLRLKEDLKTNNSYSLKINFCYCEACLKLKCYRKSCIFFQYVQRVFAVR